MIPLIQKEVVEKKAWLKESEFVEMLAIAQSAPGPIALNTAIFVGYKARGVKGVIFSSLGTILPSFIVILLIAMIFPLGISAFICLILYRRMKTARKKTEADEYMPGFTLRVKRDRYTHTTRERTYDPPQKESNSSGGSSVDSDGFGGSSGGSF